MCIPALNFGNLPGQDEPTIFLVALVSYPQRNDTGTIPLKFELGGGGVNRPKPSAAKMDALI